MAATPHPLYSLSFKPLPTSTSRNPNLLLYTPPSPPPPSASPSPPSPNLIILATWLGGSTEKRIAVYARGYQKLYPTTPILLIRTVLADITIKSFTTVQQQLALARDFLLSVFPPPANPAGNTERGGALLHVFSHGGCISALQLSRLLRAGSSTDLAFPIPLIGIILDSCPGSSSFPKAYAGATYSLPLWQPASFLGRIILLPCIGAISTLQSLGILSSIADLRRELNEQVTFGPNVPRLYLHSSADEVVAAEDVASHAAEMAEKGVSVRREVWKVAMHCALPVEDAERYWAAIRSFVAGEGHSRETKL
ncbi:hypothetical protein B0A49_12374 [Cryomyces minteri]|uniref:Uncharacterized protein n=1 Tax=Cryomyces minteri TaxID=331657 RepID=A0A4U0WKS1_9PEZI|nr:hypothetical protein B0A49_12374 [Cryomyces minteri]